MSSKVDGYEKSGGVEEAWPQQEIRQPDALLEMLYLPPLMVHVALVLIVGWIASLYKLDLLFIFTLGFAYVYYIESRQRQKIETRIRSDERKSTDRKRLLSDAETARWLNSVVQSVWPIFLENFASAHFLMRLAPWFLERFKPWTAKKVVLQKLYLGRSPPVFTMFRAGRHPTDGDHLVLEMTVNFSAARDMQATMAVQMSRRVGLGMWTSFQISNIQVEGNLKVGVRFKKGWPVIERLRICFSGAPIIRMVAKPVFSYGMDVTDLPGIAAWLDKMIIDALQQSLVEPNLLVIDVEKLVGDLMAVYAKVRSAKSPTPGCDPRGDWFHVGKKGSVATLLVEILQGESLKACDPNGKSDPYVKIIVDKEEFTTSIKKKTLEPVWHEQFVVPVVNWTSTVNLYVRDKDRFYDDEMGHKHIRIGDIRDGRRHEMWVQLDGIKTGRLQIALTVEETPTVFDEMEGTRPDSLQREESKKGSMISPREVPVGELDCSEGSESYGRLSRSDSDETPLKDESQAVDVGVGQSGCVSIVNPGRHVVKEAYSTECLRMANRSRSKSSKGSLEREKESGRAVFEENELDDLQNELVSPNGALSKRNRVRSLLRVNRSLKEKKDREDLSGELSQNANDLVIIGNTGSEVHMKLELDDEVVESLENSVMQDELPIVPESCELEGENEDCSEEPDRRSKMKKSRKGVIKQTGKNIGKAFHRSTSR